MSTFTICGDAARRVVVKQSKIKPELIELQILERGGEVIASMCLDGCAAGAVCSALQITADSIDLSVVHRCGQFVSDFGESIDPWDLAGLRVPLPTARVQAYADSNGRAPSATVGGI